MTNDYAETLRKERSKAHAVFHSAILALPKSSPSDIFLFFEGEDDPAFYHPHVRNYLHENSHSSFICYGRSDVLKVFELIKSDARAVSRSLFFIDKDHTDLLGTPPPKETTIFQTTYYSIENYLVSEEVFLGYWSEILHLDTTDERLSLYLDQFRRTYSAFEKRMLTLMALVLHARGIDGSSARKLNLNNLKLEQVFQIDFCRGTCRYRLGAGRTFARSTSTKEGSISVQSSEIRYVARKHLYGRTAKEFIRGKYELWFFVKFLQRVTQELSYREANRIPGFRRATPKIAITVENATEILSPRLKCPPDLIDFLSARRNAPVSLAGVALF